MKLLKKIEARYNAILNLLKITYGMYFCIIGFDKFFGLVTESHNRVSAFTLFVILISLSKILAVTGILEIGIGLLMFTRFMRLAVYLGIGLLMIIVINLMSMGQHFDIALHGLAITFGMIAFAQLIALKNLTEQYKSN